MVAKRFLLVTAIAVSSLLQAYPWSDKSLPGINRFEQNFGRYFNKSFIAEECTLHPLTNDCQNFSKYIDKVLERNDLFLSIDLIERQLQHDAHDAILMEGLGKLKARLNALGDSASDEEKEYLKKAFKYITSTYLERKLSMYAQEFITTQKDFQEFGDDLVKELNAIKTEKEHLDYLVAKAKQK